MKNSELKERIAKLEMQFAEKEDDEKKEESKETQMSEEDKKEFCRKFTESGLEGRIVNLEEGMGKLVEMMEKKSK